MRNLTHSIGRSFVTSRNLLVYLTSLRTIPAKGYISSCSPGYFFMILKFFGDIPSALNRGLSYEACSPAMNPRDDVFSGVLCAAIKSPKTAESFFSELELVGREKSQSTFSVAQRGKAEANRPKFSAIVLVASDNEKAIEVSCSILKTLVISTESLPSTCYLKFASCFLNMLDCAPLLKLVNDLVNELPTTRIKIIVNRIIFSFGESRQFDKALSIFDWMRKTNFGPDLVTYNTILEILGRAGRVDEMLVEFHSMKGEDIAPDFISYNTILNQLRKAGRLDLCLIHYKDMLQSDIQPDILTFTALIESLGRSGNVDEAIKVFTEMKNRSIRPSLYIYRSLINHLKKMKMNELALTMMDEMNSNLLNLAGPKEFKRKGRK